MFELVGFTTFSNWCGFLWSFYWKIGVLLKKGCFLRIINRFFYVLKAVWNIKK